MIRYDDTMTTTTIVAISQINGLRVGKKEKVEYDFGTMHACQIKLHKLNKQVRRVVKGDLNKIGCKMDEGVLVLVALSCSLVYFVSCI